MANLTQGETLTVSQDIAQAAGVELRIGGPKASTHAMTASGNCWSVNVDTSAMPAGLYSLQIWATFADDTTRVAGKLSLTLESALTEGDTRSQARIAFENIKAMLAGQAKEGVKRYKINNRELERYSMAELMTLRSHYASEVQREERRKAGRDTLGPRILVHF